MNAQPKIETPRTDYLIHVKAKKRFFRSSTVADAVAEFEAWRDANDYGASQIGARYPLLRCLSASGLETEVIGSVSYNGRVWND